MKKNTLLLFAILAATALSAQRVDTVAVYSRAMSKTIKNVVVLPESYKQGAGRYPVVYLLHGFGGVYSEWTDRMKPTLPKVASQNEMIIVCPDGGRSWYFDSPVDPSIRYETYMHKELAAWIDANYRTVASAGGRAVTGLSMGGHGGLWLGFRHQDVYGACGSMSGGVDIRPFPQNWELKKLLGEYDANPAVWDAHTVINQIYRLNGTGKPAIIIDCGTEDFFYEVNEELHRKLLYNKIPHDYISRPGAHVQRYWENAIDTQLLFFRKFFDAAK